MLSFNRTLLTVGLAGLASMMSLVMPAATDAQTQVTNTQMASTANKSSTREATIAEIASSNDAFETLTAALQAAELVDVLNGETEYTVFAPTDEAFAALPEGTVESLLLPENRDQLVRVLTYHVVPGSVMSTDLSDGVVASAEGSDLAVSLNGGSVSINGASVIQADIEARNGVIHVVDQVLLPPNL
ncbi:MAG: fasciclin domain-containing protein [Leptolyngbyaceae bacterium]|nr:fasciclin domain-containing protein [Leptolyngbyaceae bacterium]